MRCHQKCHLIAEVQNGELLAVVDAQAANRMPACREVCPIGMDVPGYLVAAAQGNFDKAMEIVRETNPFPMVCGRICHHPCETECIRGAVDEPVAIASIKRLVAEEATRRMPSAVPRTRKESVAVIGSGPAGLTAAHDLVKAGFGVTVYEAEGEIGGMLTRVIPEFKLPKASVVSDIEAIRSLGVEIRTHSRLGESITLESLRQKHDAVLLAVGSWTPAPLKIPGVDAAGVYYALPLLEEMKKGKPVGLGGRVVVIGGGNTAMDVARAAVRLGAKDVRVTCLESRKAMPALAWEIENAEREGVRIHPALAPERIRTGAGGRAAGVDFKEVASCRVDAYGSLSWTLNECAGTESFMEADSVVIAIGQIPALSSTGLKTTRRGTIEADPETLATGIPGVFA
ncbi:MAG TPA: FAD-dependent oxidoreductase, partial [Thermodesulfobacteriota bacterium]|nr:FAD-dependent oxidoreductase [Thermodesulfobacteriota bacterium]